MTDAIHIKSTPRALFLHEKCAHIVHIAKEDAPDGAASNVRPNSEEPSPEDLEAVEIWRALTPELRAVVKALPELPQAVRVGITAMVRAATGVEH